MVGEPQTAIDYGLSTINWSDYFPIEVNWLVFHSRFYIPCCPFASLLRSGAKNPKGTPVDRWWNVQTSPSRD